VAALASSGKGGEDGSKGGDEDDEMAGRMGSVEKSWDEGQERLPRGETTAEKDVPSSSGDSNSNLELSWVEFRPWIVRPLAKKGGEDVRLRVRGWWWPSERRCRGRRTRERKPRLERRRCDPTTWLGWWDRERRGRTEGGWRAGRRAAGPEAEVVVKIGTLREAVDVEGQRYRS